MEKLTKKQQEMVELIKSKQQEINQKIYVRYCGILGICLVKIIDNLKVEIVERDLNSRVAYALLNKGVLVEEGIVGACLKSK